MKKKTLFIHYAGRLDRVRVYWEADQPFEQEGVPLQLGVDSWMNWIIYVLKLIFAWFVVPCKNEFSFILVAWIGPLWSERSSTHHVSPNFQYFLYNQTINVPINVVICVNEAGLSRLRVSSPNNFTRLKYVPEVASCEYSPIMTLNSCTYRPSQVEFWQINHNIPSVDEIGSHLRPSRCIWTKLKSHHLYYWQPKFPTFTYRRI